MYDPTIVMSGPASQQGNQSSSFTRMYPNTAMYEKRLTLEITMARFDAARDHLASDSRGLFFIFNCEKGFKLIIGGSISDVCSFHKSPPFSPFYFCFTPTFRISPDPPKRFLIPLIFPIAPFPPHFLFVLFSKSKFEIPPFSGRCGRQRRSVLCM